MIDTKRQGRERFYIVSLLIVTTVIITAIVLSYFHYSGLAKSSVYDYVGDRASAELRGQLTPDDNGDNWTSAFRGLDFTADTLQYMSLDNDHFNNYLSDLETPDIITTEFMDSYLTALAVKWYINQQTEVELAPHAYTALSLDNSIRVTIDAGFMGDHFAVVVLEYPEPYLGASSPDAIAAFNVMRGVNGWHAYPSIKRVGDHWALEAIVMFKTNLIASIGYNVSYADYAAMGAPSSASVRVLSTGL